MTSRSRSRGPLTGARARRRREHTRDRCKLPPIAPASRPAKAPTGPNNAPPTAPPAEERMSDAIISLRESGTHRRAAAATRARTRLPRPPRRHAHESSCRRPVRIAACLATRPARQRNSSTSPGCDVVARDRHQMSRARFRQRLAQRGFRPVARIGRHALGLVAVQRAPDAAHQTETIAADALAAKPDAGTACRSSCALRRRCRG